MTAAVLAIGMPAALAAQTAPSLQPAAAVNAAPSNGVGSAFELTFWQSVDGSDDPAVFDAYLARYPDGTFSGLARAKIAALQRARRVEPAVVQPAVAAPAPTPVVVPAVLPQAAPAILVPASATPQTADRVQANAVIPPAEQSTPLARLLAQLRGKDAAAPAEVAQTAAPVALPVSALTVPANPYASARPVMLPVSDVLLPAHFCSTDARNAFHNNAYRPAVEAARRNNEAAVTYLRQLQQTYDSGQLGQDTARLNAISAEARAYQAEAAQAYTRQAGLVRQFDALMAVPLRTCMASAK